LGFLQRGVEDFQARGAHSYTSVDLRLAKTDARFALVR
jgi:hypothetical protein